MVYKFLSYFDLYNIFIKHHLDQGMFSLIYKFFKSLDMYKAPATLRARGQADVGSLSLGFFSILLLGLFLALLVSKLIKIIGRDSDSINYSSTLSKDFAQRQIQNIMFGVTFQQKVGNKTYTFDDYTKFYNLQAQLWNDEKQQYITQSLVPCTSQPWKLLGDQYQSMYDNSKLNRSYCLNGRRNVFTKNADSAFVKVIISKCDTTVPGCANGQKDFYQPVIQQKQSFPLYFSVLTAYPQSNDKDPLKYYIYSPKFTTTNETGQQVFMYLDKFVINTDVSLLPIIPNPQTVTAYTFSQNFYADFYLNDANITSIFQLEFFTSKNVITYNRQLQKIDSALSYVGGLFGLVFLFFNFFLKPFNQYRYELMASESSFNYNSVGRRFREKDFHFGKFLKYRLFCWLNFFTCNRINWKEQKEIDQTLTQSRKLLDVEKLFRRIQFMERVLQKKVSKSLLMSLTLVQQKSLIEVKKKRMMLDYYKQVINLQEAATVQDAMQTSVKFLYEEKLMKDQKNQKNQKKGSNNFSSPAQTNNNIINSEKDLTDKSKEIKQQLIKYLNLGECQLQCQKVSQHVALAIDAENFQFEKQDDQQEQKKGGQGQDGKDGKDQEQDQKQPTFQAIEQEITTAFINLEIEKKKQLLPQIPIKILHRMRITAKRLKSAQNLKKEPSIGSKIFTQ